MFEYIFYSPRSPGFVFHRQRLHCISPLPNIRRHSVTLAAVVVLPVGALP